MKQPSYVAVVVFCVCFAVALALAIATVCSRYMEHDFPRDFDTSESDTSHGDTLTQTLPSSGDEKKPTDGTVGGNGLRFVSNGDGTCVLAGIGSCRDACVVVPEYAPNGDRVTSVAAMAFYQCTTVSMLQLPASVTSIGGLAFAACPNLVYISVSAGNPNYRDVDGVLYTADESTLILYPPKRTGSVAVIRAVTTRIEDMAFYSCAYLQRISFTGTAEQWEEIRIGSKNYSLSAASKTFAASVDDE